ncbi:MAG: basic amino acid ABC transporter substrate-binding protein [Eubacteriales bacterium]|nr:basic amino acid ABC transporter substrate-binding protein [Eubacteriales bacterium]MDY3332665.1 basic amino acid ABC transporter substrate-binding protein [Gallibacter sp.]
MKKNTIKKIVALTTAFIICFGFTACGGNNGDSGSKEVYKAALEPTFPPFDTTDKEGKVDGFDVDLLNAIAKDQGFEVEWSNMGFDGLIPAVKSGNIDVVISGLTINDERKQEVDFSDEYFDAGFVLGVKKNNETIKDVNSLTKNDKVAAQIGTMSADIIKKWAKEGKIGEAKIYDKVNDAIMDVNNGSVAAILNDKPVLLEYISQQPDTIKIVGDTIEQQPYGIAVKKGNTKLLEKINKGLKNLKDNGEYDKLLKKWKLK